MRPALLFNYVPVMKNEVNYISSKLLDRQCTGQCHISSGAIFITNDQGLMRTPTTENIPQSNSSKSDSSGVYEVSSRSVKERIKGNQSAKFVQKYHSRQNEFFPKSH